MVLRGLNTLGEPFERRTYVVNLSAGGMYFSLSDEIPLGGDVYAVVELGKASIGSRSSARVAAQGVGVGEQIAFHEHVYGDYAAMFKIIERYRVNGLVMTPSVARALHRWSDRPPTPDQVASLRTIVTAGEAIDDDTADWLASTVGGGRVQVGNGWGLTELAGAVVVDPPVGPTPAAGPGLEIVDATGRTLTDGTTGDLVLTHPWPSTALGILGDPDARPGLDPARPGVFVTGDRARRRSDGKIDYLGRIDRVFSVSGQLVSATEVRSVLEEHPFVVRAEVVDRPDPRTGRAVVACVALSGDASGTTALADELRRHVHDTLGGLAQPQVVAFIDAFPTGGTGDDLQRGLQALTLLATRTAYLSEALLADAARSLSS